MTQSDFGTINPATKSGTQLGIDLNNWRDAVHSGHAGAARPSYVVAGMTWIDNSADPLWSIKLYDGSDDVTLYRIDTTNNVVNVFQSRQENVKTADYTLTASDAYLALIMNKASAGVVNLPALTSTNSELYFIKNIATNSVTIDPSGTETIDGATTATLAQNETAWVWPASGKGSWRISKAISEASISGKMDKANPYASVASAATIDLGALSSFAVAVTGATGPVTSFGTSAADGTQYLLRFVSTPTINNGANLITPAGENIVVFAGMHMVVRKEASNVWRVIWYTNRLRVSGGTQRVVIGASALTAERTITLPDGNVTIPAGTLVNNTHTHNAWGDIDNALAAMSTGGVGSLALAETQVAGTIGFGGTIAGSSLSPATAAGTQDGSALSGTWRCLGYAPGSGITTLWVRIS